MLELSKLQETNYNLRQSELVVDNQKDELLTTK